MVSISVVGNRASLTNACRDEHRWNPTVAAIVPLVLIVDKIIIPIGHDCMTDSLLRGSTCELMSTSANHLDDVRCFMLHATTSYLEGARFITAGNISWLCITADSGYNSEYMNCAFALCRERCLSTETGDSWHLVLLLRYTMRRSMCVSCASCQHPHASLCSPFSIQVPQQRSTLSRVDSCR